MSPTHRPADGAAQPPRPATDAEQASAPKWARSGTVRPRKVIQLRPPEPHIAGSARAGASAARVSGPDLLAQDTAFRQFLSATSDPMPVQPLQDPVGLALGMVARLMVAACAAAAVAMLLVGVFPLPSRVGVPAKSETPPLPPAAVPAAKAVTATSNLKELSSDPNVALIKDPPGAADNPAPAVAPRELRVATVSIRARPADGADHSALEPDEVARLVQRGEDSLAQGDIAAARLILGRAAEAAHDARAALSLGATFDPAVLRQLRVIGLRPDVARARAWYEKAAEYGSAEAVNRLAALPRLEH